jgi:MoaA/NifB/PqqE/SkfB family radical SAM enzyme
MKGLDRIKKRGKDINEIVICGIGEPFLHHDRVLRAAEYSRKLFGEAVPIRADTSGLWWGGNKDLSFLNYIETLSVSLNAESEEKYARICQPRIPNAYGILMDFLQALAKKRKKEGHFPDVQLTLVDTSREDLMPPRKESDPAGKCPVPDIAKCREIAEGLEFPLIVKHLFFDSHECWDTEQIENGTLGGKYLEKCAECRTRHI